MCLDRLAEPAGRVEEEGQLLMDFLALRGQRRSLSIRLEAAFQVAALDQGGPQPPQQDFR